MTQKPIAPVRKQLVVQAPQERAFRVFTADFSRWWPSGHHIGKAELKAVRLEPRVGGRWYEQGVDGSECDWGKVLLWEPPRRVVLAWQISADWQYDPSLVTEVEVSFTAQGPQATLVELEHRYLERLGETAERLRGGVDGEGGWGSLLQAFAAAAASSN